MNCHIELPSAAAAVLSVGVVITYNGDLVEEEKSGMRTVAFWAGLDC